MLHDLSPAINSIAKRAFTEMTSPVHNPANPVVQTAALMNAIDVIGYLAAILGTAAFVPQVFMTVRRRSARDISLATYVMFCAGVSLWLIYGVLQGSGPLIAANVTTLILAGTVLVIKVRTG
jgi:MtN3 and saliva related transmembrane protein